MTQVTRSQETSPVPGGEFAFTWADFSKIAEIVHSEAGIVLNETKANLVYSRLAKRLRAISLHNFRDYCQLVSSEDGADERQAMIAAMTTNVTRFFREPHHFDYLKQTVLPPLIAAARSRKRVRIWSAGCSSGEEPYSIAMSVLDLMPDAADHDVLILATDIDPNMIEKGEAATYGASAVEGIPAEYRQKWVERIQGDGALAYRIADKPRALVRFRELNLLGPWPMQGRFDAIFCRNVMIYFDDESQASIWNRFAQSLQPAGTLFIGHSERIPVSNTVFDLVGQTTYRLRQGPKT